MAQETVISQGNTRLWTEHLKGWNGHSSGQSRTLVSRLWEEDGKFSLGHIKFMGSIIGAAGCESGVLGRGWSEGINLGVFGN